VEAHQIIAGLIFALGFFEVGYYTQSFFGYLFGILMVGSVIETWYSDRKFEEEMKNDMS
jgi:hypothetical protein